MSKFMSNDRHDAHRARYLELEPVMGQPSVLLIHSEAYNAVGILIGHEQNASGQKVEVPRRPADRGCPLRGFQLSGFLVDVIEHDAVIAAIGRIQESSACRYVNIGCRSRAVMPFRQCGYMLDDREFSSAKVVQIRRNRVVQFIDGICPFFAWMEHKMPWT